MISIPDTLRNAKKRSRMVTIYEIPEDSGVQPQEGYGSGGVAPMIQPVRVTVTAHDNGYTELSVTGYTVKKDGTRKSGQSYHEVGHVGRQQWLAALSEL